MRSVRISNLLICRLLWKEEFRRYTYRLTDGITADRHGMQIITNEHIVDIIREGSRKIG